MTQNKRIENVKRENVYETVCDGCETVESGSYLNGWHHFNTHHTGWGNDSIDSYVYFDVCSWTCYLKVVRREYGAWPNGYPDGFEIDDKNAEFVRSMVLGE